LDPSKQRKKELDPSKGKAEGEILFIHTFVESSPAVRAAVEVATTIRESTARGASILGSYYIYKPNRGGGPVPNSHHCECRS
jgi:hypothetical protein